MNWRILIFLLILCQGCAVHKKSRQIDDLIKTEIKNQGLPSISASIYRNGEIVYSKGHGYADVEGKITASPSKTVYRVASISKTMTSALLSRLDQNGFFHLDSSIHIYSKIFKKKQYDFTLRQLGGHLAGIRSYKGDEWWSNKNYISTIHAAEIYAHDSLLFKPGTQYKYSTYGYNLLSMVLEERMIQHKNYSSYLKLMRDSLLRPFSMHNTYANNTSVTPLMFNRTTYYKIENKIPVLEREVNLSNKWAGGGFESTSEDIARFAQNYWFTDYVSDSIRNEYTKTNYLNNGEATNYGVGWVIKEGPKGHTWYGHAGGGVGGVSIMMVYPKEEIVIVLLCNASNAKIKTLYESVAKVMLED